MAHSIKFGVLALLFTIAAISVDHGHSLDIDPKQADLHIKCALETGPCDEKGLKMKAMIPEVMRGCGQCSYVQNVFAKRAIKYLKQHRPEALEQIMEKYRDRA
ncbi:hypothetical protein QAD02_006288 [Eretmocerus hayati]|uniref:Uncharacterized protein n=3 Tax=Eretmocerus hayati TaxID=131215 RepID=A0ACC2N1J4_9HYME|nr:hypothetical protein QAD02_006285 [Eretmocerus hayati]KAJ8664625.1 hypothetical protein QAD02_006287 [Eretmocerus hayati]KAJ8664626.1 hypothetical protein QAD02_006288 [Eretmocerus hayati]